jgi:flavin-dependent dehydrogenase
MPLDAEVIVVGGGPAGSATAALLARQGHDVLVLDRARFPRDKACAEYLSPATADALARIGALAAVEAGRPARPLGMQLVAAGRGGRAAALVHYPDGVGARRALCLRRYDLDAALLEHARACGARVLEGRQVHHVDISTAGGGAVGAVGVAVRAIGEPAGCRRVLRARAVVGADGARSVVSRALGLDRPLRGVWWPRRAGFIAHYRLARGSRSWERLAARGEMHVGRGAYCGVAPLPGRMVNVGLVVSVAAARRAGGAEAAFRQGLRRVSGAAALLADARRVGPIRGVAPLARRVARVSGDGFLLVGDAAGFLDPFTGEGVFRALRGAELAAEALNAALRRGDCSAAALAPYAARRREAFAAKEALCWLIQGLLVAPEVLGYALRRLASRPRHGDLLGGVLGDLCPAGEALRPAFIWGLLRP